MRKFIQTIQKGENLAQAEIEEAMHDIMSGKASEKDMADFLLALREKGPTVDEITGAAKIMRKFVTGIATRHKKILDTCGTGGDRKNTFNISTVTALVVAGAGVAVAKHGNRSVSSKCGSADVLEALGVNLHVEQERLSACLDEVGIAFLFAQNLHPAMKKVAPVRKKLGVETIFNLLGPLTNPARATHQILGVYSRELVEPMAHVLRNLGLKRAVVVHGSDGLDEITTTGKTFISEYDGKEIISYDIQPDELWFSPAKPRDLEGGDLETNVAICREILNGTEGPKRDIVLLNAAYALYVAEAAKNISQGLDMAKETIDSGKASQKLEELIKFTQKV
ncbi:MAG: anthranilate phosphoribosyltransferase [Omnitrophica WOR_2 bacterium RIFCSPHIGHO2_02_FULL_52_10]|nr:MAG: anthranilate phosphoribosyltransferase [Omnitrophica WOR_2 bacterium RIFCSPHIGHO2_02_FULL_52_10]